MRNILAACAFCAVALSATAQVAVDTHALTAEQHKGSGLLKTGTAPAAEPLGHGSPGPLLNVAARDATPAQRAEAGVAPPKQHGAPEQEHRRRTGPAMLLAALAVMTAIALRRLGSAGL
jgi:hypothetical protein